MEPYVCKEYSVDDINKTKKPISETEYNANGDVTVSKQFDENGEIHLKIINTYDNDQRLLNSTHFDEKNKEIQNSTYEYVDNGDSRTETETTKYGDGFIESVVDTIKGENLHLSKLYENGELVEVEEYEYNGDKLVHYTKKSDGEIVEESFFTHQISQEKIEYKVHGELESIVTMKFDHNNKLVEKKIERDSQTIEEFYTYNSYGLIDKVDISIDGKDVGYSRFEYNSNQKVVFEEHIEDYIDGELRSTAHFEYDVNNRVVSQLRNDELTIFEYKTM